MTLAEYIKENATYMSDASAAAINQIPADAWPVVLLAAKAIRAEDPGLDCEVTVTHESLADFDASVVAWAERGTREGVAGHPARIYRGCQAQRGQRRHNLAVIDCGAMRVVLNSEL